MDWMGEIKEKGEVKMIFSFFILVIGLVIVF